MSTFQNYFSNHKKRVLTVRAAPGVRVPSLGGGCLGEDRPAPGDSLGLRASAGSSIPGPRPLRLLAAAPPCGRCSGRRGVGIRAGATRGRPLISRARVPAAEAGGRLGDPGPGAPARPGKGRRREPRGWGRLHLLRVREAVSRGQLFKVPES